MKSPTRGTGFHAKIEQLDFRGQQFTIAMQSAARQLMRDAAKAWLVAVIRRIPVRTGFLVGAFKPLEDMLNVTVPTMASPKLFGKGLKGSFTGTRYDRRITDLLKNNTNANLRILADLSRYKRKIVMISDRMAEMRRHLAETEARASKVNMQDIRSAKAYATDLRKAQARVAIYDKSMKKAQERYLKLSSYVEKINERSKKGHEHGRYEVVQALRDLREKMRKLKQLRSEYNPIVGHEKSRRMKHIVDVAHEIDDPDHAAKISKLLGEAKSLKDRIRIKQMKAQKLKVVRSKLQYKFFKGSKNTYAHKEYYKHWDGRKVLKTPQSGREFRTPDDQIFQEYTPGDVISRLQAQQEATSRFLGELAMSNKDVYEGIKSGSVDTSDFAKEVQQAKTRFSFQYVVGIRYYAVNDTTGRSRKAKGIQSVVELSQQPMPWQSQLAGAQAFKSYIQSEAARRMPRVDSFFFKRTLKFDGQNVPLTDTKRIGR